MILETSFSKKKRIGFWSIKR